MKIVLFCLKKVIKSRAKKVNQKKKGTFPRTKNGQRKKYHFLASKSHGYEKNVMKNLIGKINFI